MNSYKAPREALGNSLKKLAIFSLLPIPYSDSKLFLKALDNENDENPTGRVNDDDSWRHADRSLNNNSSAL